MDKLKLIKGIVVIITFMLVFGSLMLLTVIYKKSQPKDTVYSETDLNQPQGSSIASVTEINGELAILVKGGGQEDRIIIYNPQKKQKTSAINL